MKIKYFGDTLKEDDYNSNGEINFEKYSGERVELLTASDRMSARDINRPIRSILEDVENNHELLQSLCKTLYGDKSSGAIPDIYEEMDPNGLIGGRFFDNSNFYLRIPTGAFIAHVDDKYFKDHKYTFTEGEKFARNLYIDTDHNSIVVFNRPNLELYEREIGEHFNINLRDQDNNIDVSVVNYDIEEKYNQVVVDADGNSSTEPRTRLKRKVGYYCNYKRTVYTETEEARIPNSGYSNNVFDFTSTIANFLGNYFTTKDDFFSLEEIVRVNPDWANGEYIVFFNPLTKKEYDKVLVSLSFSKRFGITRKDYFDENLDGSCVRMFHVSLKFTKKAGALTAVVPSIKTNYIKKIDRSTLTLKNIELTNAINNLVVQKIGANVNLSDAHMAYSANEYGNVAIGVKTLGYPQKNGKDQDPTQYEQANKTAIGQYNIAIGPHAMRNTTGAPSKNVGIGYRALLNVQNGAENIEIGSGTGFPVGRSKFINIGDNIYSAGTPTISNENTVIGRSNIYRLSSLGTKNIILGHYNTSTTTTLTNYKDTNHVGDNNVVLGNLNKLTSIANNNTIIGYMNENVSSTSDNVILGNKNFSATFAMESGNIVIGNGNAQNATSSASSPVLGDNNAIIGHKNIVGTDGNYYAPTSKLTNNYIFGANNIGGGDSNTLIGCNNNTRNYAGSNIVIGKGNKVVGKSEMNSTANIVMGFTNSVESSTGSTTQSFLMGNNNRFTDSNYAVGIGISNTSKKCTSPVIIGSRNTVSNADNSFVISRSFTLDSGYATSVVIGCNSGQKFGGISSTNQLILGPLSGMKFYNGDIDYSDGGVSLAAEGDTEPTPQTSQCFLKLSGNNEKVNANIYAKKINVDASELYTSGSLKAAYTVRAERMLKQNISGASVLENVPEGVPCAGEITSTSAIDIALANSKSFIGTVKDGTVLNNVISVRRSNGFEGTNGSKIGFYLKTNFGGMTDTVEKNTASKDNTKNSNQDNKGHIMFAKQVLNATDNTTTWEKNYLLDTYGNQVIDHSLAIKENLKIQGKILATEVTITSARELKKNIVPTTHKAVEEINKIKIVDFNYKTDENNENPKVGFIADDTDAIFSTREHNTIDIYNTLGMLLKAVQELSAENKELKEKIEKLEK